MNHVSPPDTRQYAHKYLFNVTEENLLSASLVIILSPSTPSLLRDPEPCPECLGAFLELVPGGLVVDPVGVPGPVSLVIDEAVEGSGACEGTREVLPGLEVLAEAESEALYGLGYFVVV